ncbi:MAG: hypothetical protein ACOCVO_01830 [bacterium]
MPISRPVAGESIELYAALSERERLGSTGLGRGIAVGVGMAIAYSRLARAGEIRAEEGR